MQTHILRSVASAWNLVLSYAFKFGVVGLVVFFLDFAIFNALIIFGSTHGLSSFPFSSVGASFISTSIAIILNWLGNRFWTFRSRRRRNVLKEFFEYLLVAFGGLTIVLVTVWISHDVLGYKSLLADNIAKNLVGQLVATVFRFSLYRFWVYGKHRGEVIPEAQDKLEQGEMSLYVEPAQRDSTN